MKANALPVSIRHQVLGLGYVVVSLAEAPLFAQDVLTLMPEAYRRDMVVLEELVTIPDSMTVRKIALVRHKKTQVIYLVMLTTEGQWLIIDAGK